MSEADDDSALEAALLRQDRPDKPLSIEEARELIESLLVPGLMARGLSAPEARVEATAVLARFERLAVDRALQVRVKGQM